MKKYFYTPVLVVLLTSIMTVRAQDRQDYLGLPGDNLNLYAVLKLFQESETLEGFERSLNDENSRINNLDLDQDGYVDYIQVIDNVDRNVHYIALQVAVNPKESQDVAVFTVIQRTNGEVFIQLIGDEALYGKGYIIEPIYDETPNPGYTPRADRRSAVVRTTTYEISAWPLVHFIFMPGYAVWHSPWYYQHYPVYWSSWSPYYWHHYHGYHSNYNSYYYGHYRQWHHYRQENWQDAYYSHHRAYSPYVGDRIHEGHYNDTYSRPDQRKEGVELYRKTHRGPRSTVTTSSSGSRTTTGSGSTSPNVRRSASGSASGSGTRQTEVKSTGRQPSAPTGTGQSTGTSSQRRSTSSGTVRSTSKPATGQSTTTNTKSRSTSTGTSRQSTKSSGTAATEKKSTGSSRSKSSKSTSDENSSSGTVRHGGR